MPDEKKNPSDYQVMHEGKTIFVADLTLEQLQQHLCIALDVLEEAGAFAHRADSRIDKYLETGK